MVPHRSSSRLVAGVLSLCMLSSPVMFAGCGGQATRASASSGEDARPDGQAIFRGLFWGEGDVAKKFPELWENSATGSPNTRERNASSLDMNVVAQQVEDYGRTLCIEGCTDILRDSFAAAVMRIRSGERDRVEINSNESIARLKGPLKDAATVAIIESLKRQEPGFFDRFGSEMQSGDPVRVRAMLNEAIGELMTAAHKLQSESKGTLAFDSAMKPKSELNGPVVLVVVIAIAVIVVAVVGRSAESELQQDILVGKIASRLSPTIAPAGLSN